MEVVTIEKISNFEGQEVVLQGWVANKRSSGKLRFIILRDGTGFIQAVVEKKKVSPEVFELVDTLTQESSVIFTGLVLADPRSPIGFEINVSDVKSVNISQEFPITPKEHGPDFLMDHRHLWLRSKRQFAILRIRAEIIRACQDFLDDRGFIRVDCPILTPAACEGTTTLFETDYFETKAYLTQSGQLYNEANCMAFGNVYCFGPTFRAEKSKTRRHLNEFWMIEPEMAFCDLDKNLKVQEEMVAYIIKRVLEKRKPELDILERNTDVLQKCTETPYPRISYDEAAEILRNNGVEFEWGGDFGGTDETILTEKFEKPFFVHRFPTQCKAFYMEPDPERPEVALCADMLAPEGYGEIIGGSVRISDLDLLEKRIKEHSLPEEAFKWYIDLRKYGSVPHAGFGMGIERVVSWICGINHVRETIAYARTINRIYP